MDRELVRTCSAEQAACLAAAAGRCVRAGASVVRILVPSGHSPIDPDGWVRYVARVELVGCDTDGVWGSRTAADVVMKLFGPYLEQPLDPPPANTSRDRAAMAA